MSRNRSCKGRFTYGVIFGGIVGGLAGLLFAPKSGQKMRKELSKKYCEVSDKTYDIIDGMCEQTCELIEKAKDIASNAKAAASRIGRRD